MKNGNYAGAIGIFTQILTNRNIYVWYVKRHSADNTATRCIDGFTMHLNLDDQGLSSDLLCQGIREQYSTEVYKQELSRLAGLQNKVTILEVGANIGYYALMAANELGDKADIRAFEPSPINIEYLSKNVGENEFENQIEVLPLAISDKPGTIEFQLAEKANQNRIKRDHIKSPDYDVVDTVDVEMTTLDNYLAENGIAPQHIDVVRMDVQGSEVDVFEGMQSILESNHSMVVFLETHPSMLSDGAHANLIQELQSSNFELVNATKTYKDLDIVSLDDERVLERDMELILRR